MATEKKVVKDEFYNPLNLYLIFDDEGFTFPQFTQSDPFYVFDYVVQKLGFTQQNVNLVNNNSDILTPIFSAYNLYAKLSQIQLAKMVQATGLSEALPEESPLDLNLYTLFENSAFVREAFKFLSDNQLYKPGNVLGIAREPKFFSEISTFISENPNADEGFLKHPNKYKKMIYSLGMKHSFVRMLKALKYHGLFTSANVGLLFSKINEQKHMLDYIFIVNDIAPRPPVDPGLTGIALLEAVTFWGRPGIPLDQEMFEYLMNNLSYSGLIQNAFNKLEENSYEPLVDMKREEVALICKYGKDSKDIAQLLIYLKKAGIVVDSADYKRLDIIAKEGHIQTMLISIETSKKLNQTFFKNLCQNLIPELSLPITTEASTSAISSTGTNSIPITFVHTPLDHMTEIILAPPTTMSASSTATTTSKPVSTSLANSAAKIGKFAVKNSGTDGLKEKKKAETSKETPVYDESYLSDSYHDDDDGITAKSRGESDSDNDDERSGMGPQ